MALAADGIDHEREVELGKRDRIDFLIGTLGVEVKIKGSLTEVTRQLMRYAESERIAELMLVTTRMQHHGRLPATMRGKPVTTVYLSPF